MFASFYLKNSLNLTLKLNEAECRICFGISFQVLAPWYPKDFLPYSSRGRGISKSSTFLVLYFEIFDLGVNLFFGQSPLFILYVQISLSTSKSELWPFGLGKFLNYIEIKSSNCRKIKQLQNGSLLANQPLIRAKFASLDPTELDAYFYLGYPVRL